MKTVRRFVFVAGALAFVAGCKSDSSTGPSGVTFPTLSSQVVAAWCVRGNLTAGGSVNGTIATSDCVYTDGTYFETYLLKVSSSRTVTVSMSSTVFDTYLGVLRITSHDATTLNYTIVDENDDISTSNTNSQVTVSLNAGSDYLIFANGYSPQDLGPYQLTIQ